MEEFKSPKPAAKSVLLFESPLIRVKLPKISVNVALKSQKKKKWNLEEFYAPSRESSYYKHLSQFPGAKKIKQQIYSRNSPKNLHPYTFIMLNPVIEENEHLESAKISQNNSPKNCKSTMQQQINYAKINSEKLDLAFCEKIVLPPMYFASSFKRKTCKKKKINSPSNIEGCERFFIRENENKAEKIGKILKLSSTPTPRSKISKYIRQESYIGGYFTSGIEDILKKMRNRSKSSLHAGFESKNNLH